MIIISLIVSFGGVLSLIFAYIKDKNNTLIMNRTILIKRIFIQVLHIINFSDISLGIEYSGLAELKINQYNTLKLKNLKYDNFFNSSDIFPNMIIGLEKAFPDPENSLYNKNIWEEKSFILNVSFNHDFYCLEYYINKLLYIILNNNKNSTITYSKSKIDKLKYLYKENNLDFNKFINSNFYKMWISKQMMRELRK